MTTRNSGDADLRIPAIWCTALVLFALVPLLYPAIPPLTDLPAHMSRFMVQMDAGRSPDLARWYSFEWNLLPNLGTDLIAWCLEPVLGLAITMKLIAVLIVALQVAGYLLLSRAAHGRVAVTAVFAVPLALGNPFQFGFLNFTLGIALVTLALALWISPAMAGRQLRRWLIFCAIASVIWVCHLAAWAVLCILVGCCELAARFERSRSVWRSLRDGFLASSCLLVPQLAALAWPHKTGHLPNENWFRMGIKAYHFANVLADRWTAWDFAGAAVLAGFIWFAWRSQKFLIHKGLAVGSLVLLAVFLVMPGTIFGSAYADLRLAPTIYALALICACPKPDRTRHWHRLWVIAAVLFVGARLCGNTVSMALWDRQIEQESRVLTSLPKGVQLLTFVALPCKDLTMQGGVRDVHIASYALMGRHAFANDQWAMVGGQLLRIDNPVVGPFFDASTSTLVGEQCQGFNQLLLAVSRVPSKVPYLWVIWHAPELPLAGWHPIARSGDSVLYRR